MERIRDKGEGVNRIAWIYVYQQRCPIFLFERTLRLTDDELQEEESGINGKKYQYPRRLR